jgi:hypothetical protein
MSEAENNPSEDHIDFLKSDFAQSFTQMRHYDGQIFEACKFVMVVYSGIAGAALGIHKYGLEKKLELSLPAASMLAIALIIGLLFFVFVIRNRTYFVKMVRYINEVRDFFYRKGVGGFPNESQMYTDRTMPRYWDWNSTQIRVAYCIAFLNAGLLAVLLYIIEKVEIGYLMASCLGLAVFQIAWGYCRLKKEERESSAVSIK